ncbi:MAG: diguanylate cyclase [Lachnospiraceae bacterium]|nr:diguanylate cyclase [Lachnospiraceae bacterium]
MKQFQITYHEEACFRKELQDFKNKCEKDGISKMMFQIYSEILEPDTVNPLCNVIEQVFPGVPYIGCSTSGNLINCQLSEEIIVVATSFEYDSTQFKVFQYDRKKNSIEWITERIVEEARQNPWVKAIEMHSTIPEGSTTQFCDGLKDISPDVQIFGGVSCSDDITSDDSCVFSSAGEYSESSILIVFYGGEDFYVDSIKITGWKPLGRKFTVTKSDGCILQELNGIPAYDVYRKYLSINNDENFFYNTLEFPLFYEHNDTTILRVPVASNADRSITMSSDIEIGSTVRISYGDPKTIVEIISEDSQRIRKFCPDLLHIFSCAARRTFWTSNEPTYELEPFKDIAPAIGFFSHGEFIRTNNCLNQHNVTLVIAAMREGEAAKTPVLDVSKNRKRLSKIPLVSRLATFISATSLELEEMNKELENANRNLRDAAITDGLTKLYNRAETQARIEKSLANIKDSKFSIIMLDIDNFKQVNDTYGHQEGDRVIITLANILRNEQMRSSSNFSAGRWGGEEFMLLLPDTELSAASLIAELIRQCFENTTFPNMRSQTISLGVTQATKEDTQDTLCTRVDTALYRAKKGGKNKVVVL